MSKKLTHVHKYKKIKWGRKKTIIWRCMLPGCSHYIHHELVRNRKSLCYKCDAVFIMNPDKMRRTKPKCDRCQIKVEDFTVNLDALIENL